VTPEARARAAGWLPPGMGVQTDSFADADVDDTNTSEADAAEEAAPAAAA
jgi:hypothetical protein